MTKFEYKTETINLGGTIFNHRSLDYEGLTKTLNNYGNEGWELTSKIDIQTNGWTKTITLIFKREVN